MKKTVIYLLFMGLVSTGQAQEATKMEPVNLEATSLSMKLDPTTNVLTVMIPEKQDESFHSNPLKFAQSNFDIRQLIKDNDSKYDSYTVTFRSHKGRLIMNYNNKGKTMSTFQTFKNVELPYEMYQAIYMDHRDWDIVRNKYIAATRNGVVKREFYKIKLQNGKKDKSMKIPIKKGQSMLGVAFE